MSDTQTPTAPNYSPYLTAFQDIANAAKSHGDDALKWAQDQVANNKDLLAQVNKGLLDTQTSFQDAAKQRLQQAGDTISTGLQNLKDQYTKYTDPAHKAASIGAAEAGAAQANEAARNASMAELESYGLNPGAVRYAGLDAAARAQDAASRVGAGNVAARTDDALADQTNQQILNEGNQLAGQANANAGTAGGAGTGAVSGANATTGTGAGVLGTGLQWTGAGTNALTGGVNTQNTQFSNQATADKMSNDASSGFGSLLGLGASMLGKGGAFGAGGALAFLEDGGAVDDIGGDGGGAVPTDMSPSGGAAIDDVDAVSPGGPAKLNAGEFVVPKDVTSWYGEKFMQNLIMKARNEKQGAGAKPQQKPSGPEPSDPAFQPRPQPQQGALPV
jgi:hypothetical protein